MNGSKTNLSYLTCSNFKVPLTLSKSDPKITFNLKKIKVKKKVKIKSVYNVNVSNRDFVNILNIFSLTHSYDQSTKAQWHPQPRQALSKEAAEDERGRQRNNGEREREKLLRAYLVTFLDKTASYAVTPPEKWALERFEKYWGLLFKTKTRFS